jgi:hypothetical protein
MQHNPKQKGAILRLIGTVRDADGNEIQTFTKDNDIYLWNWAVFWANILKQNFCPTDPTIYQYKGIDGIAANTPVNALYAYNWTTENFHGKWRVQIGGGSVAPAITDYKLGSALQAVNPTFPEIITDGAILKIVFSSTFAFGAQTVVSEIAILGDGIMRPDDIPYLITRDTFTPQTVPSGGSITLQHELWFNGTPPAV